MRVDRFPRFTAGFRAEDLILLLHVGLQDFPVDKLVFNDQHKPFPAFRFPVGNTVHPFPVCHMSSPLIHP